MTIEAMKLALEALELEAAGWDSVSTITRDAIIALLAAIEEAKKQEPVECMCGLCKLEPRTSIGALLKD